MNPAWCGTPTSGWPNAQKPLRPGTPATTNVLALGGTTRVSWRMRGSGHAAVDVDARWILTSERARELFVDWEEQARDAVDALRLDCGRHPGDPGARRLVAELSASSVEFRDWWARHRVHRRPHGAKRLHHPLVGELTVDFETLTLPGDADQAMYVYTTAPGSSSREALDLLGSWTGVPTTTAA
jgi:hypothetical protein